MNSVEKNVLFTGGRSPVTLDLIRLFAESGYNVFIAESFKGNLCGSSKFIKKNILVPPPATETEDFIDSLIDIIKEFKISTLVPTCEEVFYISKYKEKLDKHCYVFTSDIEKLTKLHSKFLFVELLKKVGISAPESILITNKEQLKSELAQKTEFVLKPEFSRFSAHVIINDKSSEKINKIKVDEDYPWVLQQFLKGKAFCSYSVAQDGKVLAHSIYPSIYCAGQGATIYFENIYIPEIDEIVSKIVKELNYTGQIAFDIIQSDHDGNFYPIECNPRATSGVYLFDKKDNLPEAFRKNTPLTEIIRANPDKSKMVALAMIIYGLPKVRSFSEGKSFFSKMISSKDVVFKLKDLKPFVSQFMGFSYYAAEGKKKNMTVMEASTIDIEWNGN